MQKKILWFCDETYNTETGAREDYAGGKNGFQFKIPPPTFKHTIAINLLIRGITGDPEIKFPIHVKFTLLR